MYRPSPFQTSFLQPSPCEDEPSSASGLLSADSAASAWSLGGGCFLGSGSSSSSTVFNLPALQEDLCLGLEHGSSVMASSDITMDPPPGLKPRDSCNLRLKGHDIVATDEVLGQGAWGDVCRGRWQDKDVAIKIVRWNGEQPEELLALQHEVNMLALLKHPHIVTMYGGCAQPDPHIFIVQELMSGSVSDVMYGRNGQPGRRLSLLEALQIGRDVLHGLCYLHEHQVVHRDIKPDNMLLTTEGVAKIADFGISFKVNAMLHAGTVDGGTAAYMAPECFDPALGAVGTPVDMYAWALMMWEMVMGQRPYHDMKRHPAIIWQVVQCYRPHMPEPSAEFPLQLMQLIQQCWAQQPERRPQAAQALDALDRIICDGTAVKHI